MTVLDPDGRELETQTPRPARDVSLRPQLRVSRVANVCARVYVQCGCAFPRRDAALQQERTNERASSGRSGVVRKGKDADGTALKRGPVDRCSVVFPRYLTELGAFYRSVQLPGPFRSLLRTESLFRSGSRSIAAERRKESDVRARWGERSAAAETTTVNPSRAELTGNCRENPDRRCLIKQDCRDMPRMCEPLISRRSIEKKSKKEKEEHRPKAKCRDKDRP